MTQRTPAFSTPATASITYAPSIRRAAHNIKHGERGAVVVRGAYSRIKWRLPLRRVPANLDEGDIPIRVRVAERSKEPGRSPNGRPDQDASDEQGLSAHAELPDGLKESLPEDVLQILRDLAVAHAATMEGTFKENQEIDVLGRVAIVNGTRCPRIHADSVRLRTMCSIWGPGPVLAPIESIKLDQLQSGMPAFDPYLSTEQHDAIVLRDDLHLVHTRCGDAVFLTGRNGAFVDGQERVEGIAFHRSPRQAKGQLRLLLQIDDVLA